MRLNKWLIVLLVFLSICCRRVWAQDQMPLSCASPRLTKSLLPLPERRKGNDTIVAGVSLPVTFAGVKKNEIVDSLGALSPVLEHLLLARAGAQEDTVRIMHIGDSHIRGHIYPRTTGKKLGETFGAVSYMDMGVNGATCLTFTHPDRIAAIAAFQPALLILSFGTNESHNRHYNANAHYQQMSDFVTLLHGRLPDVPILLTTPPGSYDSFRRRRQKRTYAVNPRTAIAVETIHRFASDHQLLVWDMYNVVGGSRYACKNWVKANLMRPDHVHYMPEGYILQGELLYEAIIKVYNEYVSH